MTPDPPFPTDSVASASTPVFPRRARNGRQGQPGVAKAVSPRLPLCAESGSGILPTRAGVRFLPGVLLLILFAGLSACNAPDTPVPDAATGSSTAAGEPSEPAEPALIPLADLRADFDALYAQLQASHYDVYVRRDKADYDALFERMKADLTEPLPAHEVRQRFQRFVAHGRIAHARIDLPMERWNAFREAGGKALPLFVRVDDGRVHVADDYSGLDQLAIGDELLSVDGVPALAWLEPMRELVSADNDYMAYAQMEHMLPALAWLDHGEVDGHAIELVKPDGRRLALRLPARSRAEFEAAKAARTVPAGPDMSTREARMLDGGIAYLRPGPFYDNRPDAANMWDRAAFRAFIDEAFTGFLAAGAGDLLIDLRDNPGGDNSFSDLLVAWFADRPFRFAEQFDIRVSAAAVASNQARLEAQPSDAGGTSAELAALYAGKQPGSRVGYPIPLVQPRDGERFRGRVHALINRHSYSNTVLVAAILQDYGFGRVLGEETSDLASTYGAMEHFQLPRTGITVGFPKARILRPSGDDQARGVIPDVAIETPLAGDVHGEVLERALALIRSARPAPAGGRTGE